MMNEKRNDNDRWSMIEERAKKSSTPLLDVFIENEDYKDHEKALKQIPYAKDVLNGIIGSFKYGKAGYDLWDKYLFSPATKRSINFINEKILARQKESKDKKIRFSQDSNFVKYNSYLVKNGIIPRHLAERYNKLYREQSKNGNKGIYAKVENMYHDAIKFRENEKNLSAKDRDNYESLEEDYSDFYVNNGLDINKKLGEGIYKEESNEHFQDKAQHLTGTSQRLYNIDREASRMNWIRKNRKAKDDIKYFEKEFKKLIEKKNKEIDKKEKEYTYNTGGDKKTGLSDAESLELTDDRLAVARAEGEHLNSRLENMTYSSKEEKAKDEEAQKKNIKEVQRLTSERRGLKERMENKGAETAEPKASGEETAAPANESTNSGMGHGESGDDCCCCKELKAIREILANSPLGDADKKTINDKLTKVETKIQGYREVYASRNSSVPEAVVNGPATASFSPQPEVVNGPEVEPLTSEFAAGGSGDRINSNKLYRNNNDVIINKPYTDMSPQITRHAIYRPNQDYKYIVEKFGGRACDTSSPFAGPGSFTVNSGIFGNASETSRLDEQHYALARSGRGFRGIGSRLGRGFTSGPAARSGFRGVGSRLGRGFTTGPAARLGNEDLFAELNKPLDMALPEFHNEKIADFQSKVTGSVMAPSPVEKADVSYNNIHQTLKQIKDMLNNRLPSDYF